MVGAPPCDAPTTFGGAPTILGGAPTTLGGAPTTLGGTPTILDGLLTRFLLLHLVYPLQRQLRVPYDGINFVNITGFCRRGILPHI